MHLKVSHDIRVIVQLSCKCFLSNATLSQNRDDSTMRNIFLFVNDLVFEACKFTLSGVYNISILVPAEPIDQLTDNMELLYMHIYFRHRVDFEDRKSVV